jgi:hypothetical protein
MAGKAGATIPDAIGSRSAQQPAGRELAKPTPVASPDDVLTPAEAKRLRQSLKQTTQGKTRSWAAIKNELGL